MPADERRLDRLRRAMRRRRRTLDPARRRLLAEHTAEHLCAHPLFRRARRIAAYLATDGELDPAPVVRRAMAMGKQICLPMLLPWHYNRLWFVPWAAGDPLVRNRFGIAEPRPARDRRPIAPHALDLVLTPLVAFDRNCRRMGMGGGYYDRSFAFLGRRRHWNKPRLLGLAYGFQEVETLPVRPWDVPLAGVATEHGVRLCLPVPTTAEES